MSIKAVVTEQEDSSNEWLVTYADMITLLLTFFVLMVSMSTTDAIRFRQAVKAIKQTMANEPVVMEVRAKKVTSAMVGSREQTMVRQVNNMLKVMPPQLQNLISAQYDRRKLLITVKDSALFDTGNANLKPEADKVLAGVANVLKTLPDYIIHIEGHTDNQPINTPIFPSNWELSAVRATKVLRFMLKQGIPAWRMTATGYADVEPIAPNNTAENRSMNRRVEFVLEEET